MLSLSGGSENCNQEKESEGPPPTETKENNYCDPECKSCHIIYSLIKMLFSLLLRALEYPQFLFAIVVPENSYLQEIFECLQPVNSHLQVNFGCLQYHWIILLVDLAIVV